VRIGYAVDNLLRERFVEVLHVMAEPLGFEYVGTARTIRGVDCERTSRGEKGPSIEARKIQ
jgi:hypothetical protein